MSWRDYQEQAAQFFRELGLSTAIEEEVVGTRGKHRVDVYVTGRVHGLSIRWIVECKHWSTNVPKEKVLALLAIVQDTGVDKGILLSEVGFQSGAIRTSTNTNLLLTSLADLRDEMNASLAETIISTLHWRLTKVSKRLSALHKKDKEDYLFTPALSEKAKIMLLDAAFGDALNDEYPTIYTIGAGETRVAASDFGELVREADRLLTDAEAYVLKMDHTLPQP